MVQANSAVTYKVKQEDLYADSRLGIQSEYFECPICMLMLPNILECPNCWARACDDCLVQFVSHQRGVTENDKINKNLPCTQCHEKVAMRQPNRIMTFLLKSVFRINCPECQRHWLYDDYIQHKQRGQCRRDPNADNTIAALSNIERRPTAVQNPSGGATFVAQSQVAPQPVN